jgi:hypothetical protein
MLFSDALLHTSLLYSTCICVVRHRHRIRLYPSSCLCLQYTMGEILPDSSLEHARDTEKKRFRLRRLVGTLETLPKRTDVSAYSNSLGSFEVLKNLDKAMTTVRAFSTVDILLFSQRLTYHRYLTSHQDGSPRMMLPFLTRSALLVASTAAHQYSASSPNLRDANTNRGLGFNAKDAVNGNGHLSNVPSHRKNDEEDGAAKTRFGEMVTKSDMVHDSSKSFLSRQAVFKQWRMVSYSCVSTFGPISAFSSAYPMVFDGHGYPDSSDDFPSKTTRTPHYCVYLSGSTHFHPRAPSLTTILNILPTRLCNTSRRTPSPRLLQCTRSHVYIRAYHASGSHPCDLGSIRICTTRRLHCCRPRIRWDDRINMARRCVVKELHRRVPK